MRVLGVDPGTATLGYGVVDAGPPLRLVECGILIKQEDDRKEDFRAVFDFEEAFELGYPWGAKP